MNLKEFVNTHEDYNVLFKNTTSDVCIGVIGDIDIPSGYAYTDICSIIDEECFNEPWAISAREFIETKILNSEK